MQDDYAVHATMSFILKTASWLDKKIFNYYMLESTA